MPAPVRMAAVWLALCTLSACGDDSGPLPDATPAAVSANALVASGPGPVTVAVGETATFVVTLAPDDARAVTDVSLGTVPGGWSVSGAAGCRTVAAAGCTLTLTFAPVASGRGTAGFDLAYRDASGQDRAGRFEVPFVATAEHVYVIQHDVGQVRRCRVDGSGELVGCETALTGLQMPVGMAVRGRHLYALSSGLGEPGGAEGPGVGRPTRCVIRDDGTLAECAEIDPQVALGMSMAFRGERAWISSVAAGELIGCRVDEDGALLDCVATTVDGGPHGLQVVGDRLYYAPAGAMDGIRRCTIQPDDTLVGCTIAGSGHGFGFNLAIVDGVAWLPQYVDGGVRRCSVAPSGDLEDCSEALPAGTLSSPFGVAVRDGHVYLTSTGDGRIVRCAIGGAGALGACTNVAEGVGMAARMAVVALP